MVKELVITGIQHTQQKQLLYGHYSRTTDVSHYYEIHLNRVPTVAVK